MLPRAGYTATLLWLRVVLRIRAQEFQDLVFRVPNPSPRSQPHRTVDPSTAISGDATSDRAIGDDAELGVHVDSRLYQPMWRRRQRTWYAATLLLVTSASTDARSCPQLNSGLGVSTAACPRVGVCDRACAGWGNGGRHRVRRLRGSHHDGGCVRVLCDRNGTRSAPAATCESASPSRAHRRA